MSRLFLKVFAVVWLGLALIAILAGVSTWLFLADRVPPPQARAAAMVDGWSEIAAERFSRNPRRALAWLRRRPPLLFDVAVVAKDAIWFPPAANSAWVRELASGGSAVERQITTSDGAAFTLIVAPNRTLLGPPPLGRGFSGLRLMVALAFSVAVAALLASLLSRPVRRVRNAASRLKKGDLSARAQVPKPWFADEIHDLGREFDEMAADLQETLASQRQLLRDVSHELRAPLARLRVAVELARSRNASPELDRVDIEADRLEELVESVLASARGLSRDGGARERVDLSALVTQLAEVSAREFASSGKRIVWVNRQHAFIEADTELLRRAIENILRNALHYNAVNSAVELSLGKESGEAVLQVRDHGPGVATADLEKLFDPFFRTDQARARSTGGHGLGLAIARSAVEAHGGRITAMNAADGGLVLTMRLPAAS